MEEINKNNSINFQEENSITNQDNTNITPESNIEIQSPESIPISISIQSKLRKNVFPIDRKIRYFIYIMELLCLLNFLFRINLILHIKLLYLLYNYFFYSVKEYTLDKTKQ